MKATSKVWLILLTALVHSLGCQQNGDQEELASPASSVTQTTPRLTVATDQLEEIMAVGTNFKWTFIDVGLDGVEGTVDDYNYGNTLRLPAGQQVKLNLRSTDYVYTLNVPDGRIQAVIPDLDRSIQFQMPSTGTHFFKTDPMCGLRYFHDDVLGVLEVLPENLQ